MGCRDDLRIAEQRRISRQRFGRENIESRSGDSAVFDSFDQRIFIDEAASGGIDDANAFLHLGKCILTDDAVARQLQACEW